MEDRQRRVVRFDELNSAGKAVYLVGATARVLSDGLDTLLRRGARLVADTERAFREGTADPRQIEDAKYRDL